MKEYLGKIISHYKIVELIGRGGMGVVYKAEDTKLKRTVALKFLPPSFSLDEDAKKRFIHEAQAASSLQHNNICTVHDIDETEDGQMFICMDCYAGETLSKKIARGPLKLDDSIDITIQINQGLLKAHEQKIIHRDIKPANIFITNDGIVKILDFGLAKLSRQTVMTKMGSTVGTIAYMSPEQTKGEMVDHRTDIWSLGVVFYEMITGQLPFKGDYDQAVTYSIINEVAEPPTALRTGVPMELERIVNKTLAKNPDERYQRVDEMLVDLKGLGKEFESGTTKQTVITTPLKPNRKKYVIGVIAGLFLVLLVAFYFIFLNKPLTIERKSVAVLPFQNISEDKANEYFSDGITEDVITHLSKIGDLKVISRTSTMLYKDSKKSLQEIGRELGVETILEGSVRRAGNRVRIVSQLIDAKTDEHIWAETYDREMKDIFAIQSDVAKQIAAALKVKFSFSEKERIEKIQTENTEAYQLYLKGRFHWNKRTLADIEKAIDYFNQAIEKDPNYALAYAGLASAYVVLPDYYGLPPKDVYPKTEASVRKALELDATLSEPYAVMGLMKAHQWDWESAESEYKRSIELNPNYPTVHQWYSILLSSLRRLDEALAEIKRAQELDPLSLVINYNVGWAMYFMRQYDKAIDQFRETLDLDPNYISARVSLGGLYAAQGKFEEAISELQKARSLVDRGDPTSLAELGSTYALAGRKDEAQKILDELLEYSKQGYPVSLAIATVYGGLGDKEKVFEWLESAYQSRESKFPLINVHPVCDSIRSDPRFIALLKKIGLEE